MIKKLLAGTALCVIPFAASAADMRLPTKAVPYIAPAYSWAGFYIGGHVGYGWGNHDVELLADDHESEGFLGGVQVGYNFQTGNWVLGIEADYSFSDVNSSDRVSFTNGPGTSNTAIKHELNYLWSVRGRLGYAMGNVLPYITGGWAFGEIKSSATAVNTGFGAPFDGTFRGSDTQTHDGWVLGGGMEFAFSGNWTGRLEYLHYDLSKEKYLALPQLDPVARSHDPVIDVVRVGLNYRFGGPVVARY